MNFWTAPFDAVRTPFFFRAAAVLHGKGRINRTGRITIFVKAYFYQGTLITGIVGNQSFLKTEVIFESTINIGRIKSSISQEGIWMEAGVCSKKSVRMGFKATESLMVLSSSGESDFFSMGSSGWEALKLSSRKTISRTMPRPFVRMANLSA